MYSELAREQSQVQSHAHMSHHAAMHDRAWANMQHGPRDPRVHGSYSVSGSLMAVLQAHAFAEGLDKNGADRTLQHGFADALALMARIKATQVPTGNTATAPDPAPPVSLEEFEPAAPQELSPELPPPGEHDPPDNDSGDSASTGENLAEDAADDAPACKDVTAVDEERENSGAAADHAPDEEQPKVALEGVAAAPVAEPSEGTAEEEEEAAVLEEAGEQQGDGEQAGDADDSGVGM